jgi:uncharacterized membrane protein
MQALIQGATSRPPRAQVRSVSMLRPFVWVGRGTVDLLRCWRQDLAHAVLIVVFGWVLLFLLGAHPYFLAAALSGFLLGAPVMATGLVELSRRVETGETTNFNDSLAPLEHNGPALVQFGAVLAAFAVAWFVVSGLFLATVLNVPTPDFIETFYRGFLDRATRVQLVSYVAVGALLALLVFVLSVVTVPSIIDQHLGAWQAMCRSIDAVRANPSAMVVWSALLVVLTAIGFVTLLFGMLVVIPLLGHATWHAYRDLVRV